MARPTAILLTAFLLTACSHYVYVSHLLPPRRLPAASLGALNTTVVVMELERGNGPAGLLGSAVIGLVKSLSDSDRTLHMPLPRMEARMILEQTARALRSPVSRVVAFMVRDPSSTLFIEAFNPSAVLVLKPGEITSEQRPVRIRRKDGDRTVFDLNARFAIAYSLESWPGRKTLTSGVFEDGVRARSARELSLREWTRDQIDIRFSWLPALKVDLLPVRVKRARKLNKGKSKELRAGYRAARKGNWGDASRGWETEKDVYQACWNLGVHHERRGEWERARNWYGYARAAAPKEKDRRILAGYLGELERIHTSLPPAAETGSAGWFGESLAVLPFANESVNVGAPDRVRRAVQAEMVRKGYSPLDPAKVDAGLKEKGITTGGQLRAANPKDLARSLKMRRLLGGKIVKFKTVNTGLYSLNTVSVEISLYDQTGQNLWTARGTGYREILTRPEDAGTSFLLGLAETAVTKAVRIHLETELRTAVAHALESMPSRPGGEPR